MEIRNRLYPYPVLSNMNDDYFNSSFDVSINIIKDGYNIRFELKSQINNDGILSLVNEGKAKFVYHLECAQTGFRKAIATEHTEIVHVEHGTKLRGRMQICPFIVAYEDIPDYNNDLFHRDYRGIKFTIESGCVIAVGSQINADFDPEINDFSNPPSVFSIIKNADETQKDMVVDINQRKIIIKLNEAEYYSYLNLKENVLLSPILHSLVITPTLVYVLGEIANKSPDERYNYSSYAWYRAVKKALFEKFNTNIEEENFSEKNLITLAQQLIDSPLPNAFNILADGYSVINDDEDYE